MDGVKENERWLKRMENGWILWGSACRGSLVSDWVQVVSFKDGFEIGSNGFGEYPSGHRSLKVAFCRDSPQGMLLAFDDIIGWLNQSPSGHMVGRVIDKMHFHSAPPHGLSPLHAVAERRKFSFPPRITKLVPAFFTIPREAEVPMPRHSGCKYPAGNPRLPNVQGTKCLPALNPHKVPKKLQIF